MGGTRGIYRSLAHGRAAVRDGLAPVEAGHTAPGGLPRSQGPDYRRGAESGLDIGPGRGTSPETGIPVAETVTGIDGGSGQVRGQRALQHLLDAHVMRGGPGLEPAPGRGAKAYAGLHPRLPGFRFFGIPVFGFSVSTGSVRSLLSRAVRSRGRGVRFMFLTVPPP